MKKVVKNVKIISLEQIGDVMLILKVVMLKLEITVLYVQLDFKELKIINAQVSP